MDYTIVSRPYYNEALLGLILGLCLIGLTFTLVPLIIDCVRSLRKKAMEARDDCDGYGQYEYSSYSRQDNENHEKRIAFVVKEKFPPDFASEEFWLRVVAVDGTYGEIIDDNSLYAMLEVGDTFYARLVKDDPDNVSGWYLEDTSLSNAY